MAIGLTPKQAETDSPESVVPVIVRLIVPTTVAWFSVSSRASVVPVTVRLMVPTTVASFVVNVSASVVPTMLRVMNSVSESVKDAASSDLKDMLYKVGWSVMCADGGSTSPLIGSLFMGMSDAVEGKDELAPADVALMFESGLAKMFKQSKASVGDKTMMDALIPAVDAMKASAGADEGIDMMLAKARDAAVKGAASTSELVAKFGRARNLGDRVIGHKDPGSVSISLIFQGFCESFTN